VTPRDRKCNRNAVIRLRRSSLDSTRRKTIPPDYTTHSRAMSTADELRRALTALGSERREVSARPRETTTTRDAREGRRLTREMHPSILGTGERAVEGAGDEPTRETGGPSRDETTATIVEGGRDVGGARGGGGVGAETKVGGGTARAAHVRGTVGNAEKEENEHGGEGERCVREAEDDRGGGVGEERRD